MSNVKVVLNSDGVREMLRSEQMLEMCKEYANNALKNLGEGYEVTSMVGKNRCNAQVEAVSAKAKKENMKQNTILKAVRGK